MTETARVVRELGYVRVSARDWEDRGVGLDDQASALGDHHSRLDVDLVEFYRDKAPSCVTDNSPGPQVLIDHAVRAGSGITEIGVCSFSRFARDRGTFEQYRQRLEHAGIRIVSITGDAAQRSESEVSRSTVSTS